MAVGLWLNGAFAWERYDSVMHGRRVFKGGSGATWTRTHAHAHGFVTGRDVRGRAALGQKGCIPRLTPIRTPLPPSYFPPMPFWPLTALPANLAGGLAQLRLAYRAGGLHDDGSQHTASGPYNAGGALGGGGGGGASGPFGRGSTAAYQDSGYLSEQAVPIAHAHSALSAAGSAALRVTRSNHPTSYSYSGWGAPAAPAGGAFSATNMTTYAGLQQQLQMQHSAMSQQQHHHHQQHQQPHLTAQRISLQAQQLSQSQSQQPLAAQASAPVISERPGLPPLPPGRGWSLRRSQASASVLPVATGGGAAALGYGTGTSGSISPAVGGGRHFSGSQFPNPLASSSGAPLSSSPPAAAGPHFSPFASYQAAAAAGAVASARSTALLSTGGGADPDPDGYAFGAASSSAATAAAVGLLTMPSRGVSNQGGLDPSPLSAAVQLTTAAGEVQELAAVDEEEQLTSSHGSRETQVYAAAPSVGAPSAAALSTGPPSAGAPSAGAGAGAGVGMAAGAGGAASGGVLTYRVSLGSQHEQEGAGELRRTSLAGPSMHRLSRSRGPSHNGVAEDREGCARLPRPQLQVQLPSPAQAQQHREAEMEGAGPEQEQQQAQQEQDPEQQQDRGEGEGINPRDSAQDRPGHATALEAAQAALKGRKRGGGDGEPNGKNGGDGGKGGGGKDRQHPQQGEGDEEQQQQQQQQQMPQSYPAPQQGQGQAGYGPEPPYLRPHASVPYPAAPPPPPAVPAPRAARARRASAGVYGPCGSPFGMPPPGYPHPYPQSPGAGAGVASPFYPPVMAAGGGFAGLGGGGGAAAAHVSMAEALLSPRMASATAGVRRHPFFGGVDRDGNDVITNVVPRAAGSFLATNRRGSLLNLMAAAFSGGAASGSGMAAAAAAPAPPPAPYITPVGRFAAGAYGPIAAGASPVLIPAHGSGGGGSLVVSPRMASATGMPSAFMAEVLRRRTREDARRVGRAARSGSGAGNPSAEPTPTPGALVLENAAAAGVSGTAAGLVAALNVGRRSVTSLGAVLRKRLAGSALLSAGGVSSGAGSGGPNSAEIAAASRAASGSRGPLPLGPAGLGSAGPGAASGPGGISGGGAPLSGSIIRGLGLEGAGVVDEFGVDDDYCYYGMSSGSPWSGAMSQQQQQMQTQQQQQYAPMQAFGISGGGGGGGMPPPDYPGTGGGGGGPGGYGEFRDIGGAGGYPRDSAPHPSGSGSGKVVNSIAANPAPKPLQDAAVIKIFISYVQVGGWVRLCLLVVVKWFVLGRLHATLVPNHPV